MADSAARALEARLRRQPREDWFHLALLTAYALQGHRDEALRSGRRALELLPVSRDALDGASYLKEVAYLHVLLGDQTGALDLIERQLALPSQYGPAYYRSDVRFASAPGKRAVRATDRPREILTAPPRGAAPAGSANRGRVLSSASY